MQQGAVLAMLAKEPAHGYQLRARLREALGPVGVEVFLRARAHSSTREGDVHRDVLFA